MDNRIKCTECGSKNVAHFEDHWFNCTDCMETFPYEPIGELIQGRFELMNEPHAVQLTIHINNLINWQLRTGLYNQEQILDIIKLALTANNRKPVFGSIGYRVNEMCLHYGTNYIRNWCNEIYGWKFEVAA